MSLNWNVSKVADSDTTCFYIAGADDPDRGISHGDKVLSGLTETLIFATMAVGLGQITRANHREFYSRIATYERLNGEFRNRYNGTGHEGMPVTLPQVVAHIGLTTNVSKESDTEWRKRIFTNAAREFLYVADAKAKREAAQ